MDVKIGDWVVTPRYGNRSRFRRCGFEPWISAKHWRGGLEKQSYADRCQDDRGRAIASFRRRFWYEEGGYLYDAIDGPEGDGCLVASQSALCHLARR